MRSYVLPWKEEFDLIYRRETSHANAMWQADWGRVEPLLPEELFTLAGRSYLDGNFPHKPFASVVAPSFAEILPCRTVFYLRSSLPFIRSTRERAG